MEITTHTPNGTDKVKRYGWETKDEPGKLQMLHKDALKIHPEYQRDLLPGKVKEITAQWSWISLGALVVGERDGQYWVIDGQHRAVAAKRRSDVTMLPCVVFQTRDIKAEARGFLDLNAGRKPVTAIAKQKALVIAGDETARFVQETLHGLGIDIRVSPTKAGEIKCVRWCTKRAAEDAEAFVQVLTLCYEISARDNMPIAERLLEGLWVLNARCGSGLDDKRLVKRVREKGARTLLDAANRAAAFYTTGGGGVWAKGMLAEINKGLTHKFSFDSEG